MYGYYREKLYVNYFWELKRIPLHICKKSHLSFDNLRVVITSRVQQLKKIKLWWQSCSALMFQGAKCFRGKKIACFFWQRNNLSYTYWDLHIKRNPAKIGANSQPIRKANDCDIDSGTSQWRATKHVAFC